MKYFGLVLLLTFSLVSYSQNLENLDLKYGFNKFKLGGSFESYKKDLEFLNFPKNNSGVRYYNYKKKDISIFGFTDIDQIGLGFYKDKLYSVDIVLNPHFKKNMFSTILSNLENLFGSANIISNGVESDDGDGSSYMENINQWKTSKTLLGLNTFKCNSPTRPCTVNVFLVSQVIQRQINNDGF